MRVFAIAFFYVWIAEMGDKTQLVALAFATRFRATLVLSGVLGATLLIHLISVALGEALGAMLPTFWLRLLAGLAFIGFGVWTLRGDTLEDERSTPHHRWGALFTVGTTFFLAELGDKTMLTTVTLASQYHTFIPVWLGSSLGMVFADGLAIFAGQALGKKLPERLIQRGAAILFFASGLWMLFQLL